MPALDDEVDKYRDTNKELEAPEISQGLCH
jgi:hypothetical protein